MSQKKTLSKEVTSGKEVEHPGIMLQDFIVQQGLYQMEAAGYMGMTPSNMNDIIRGIRSITPDIALRLGKAFNLDPIYWLTLQMHYDLARARKSPRTIKKMARVIVFNPKKHVSRR